MEKIVVARENLAAVRALIEPAYHRDNVAVGDIVSHRRFRNRHGVDGTLTVWHNRGRGAIQFGNGSFWGDWRAAGHTLKLDDVSGGEEFDLAGNQVEKGETEN